MEHAVNFEQKTDANVVSPVDDLNFSIADLKRRIDLATGQKEVNEACTKLGDNVIKDPFMLLSFMSLPVIPSLKLTDKDLLMLINLNLPISGQIN